MSYSDIDVYLNAYGVDTGKQTSGVNSKWVYTKELLTDEPAEIILRIATELDIPHAYAIAPTSETVEATFWEPHHFRLFLSHLSSFKKPTGNLQNALRRFGISAFVAHVDIEPTREWQNEIEAGLFSMDALAAILMPGFKESNWTDQEVGVAVGRGVPVIPIIRGLDPYGFIGKYQGLKVDGKTVAQVAFEVFRILATTEKTRGRMLTCLVDTMHHSANEKGALEKLNSLKTIEDVPLAYLERLRTGAESSAIFAQGPVLDELNKLLIDRGLQKVASEQERALALDEALPF
jgi:hypothetical protein